MNPPHISPRTGTPSATEERAWERTGLGSGRLHRLFCVLVLLVLAGSAWAAGPFNVNVTNDTHAVSSSTSPNDSTGHVSLRSAIEAANAQTGATTIKIPPGTYNLGLGELDVATNAGNNIVIQATGTVTTTIVNQTDGTNRVFNVDPNSRGNNTVTLLGLTIQGGHDQADIAGGAGILAGSLAVTPKDVLNLGGCVIANNHCSPPNTNYTAQIGGGVQMAGGDLDIIGCVFTNNSSGASSGGALACFAQGVNSSISVNESLFINNSLTNTSGSGPDGGGAIFIGSTPGSVVTIGNSYFVGNQAVGVFGNTYGGAIAFNTGTLNITNSMFSDNQATSGNAVGGQGGAIYVDAGTNTLSFCRLTGNTAVNGGGAVYSHGSNGAFTQATNDWWGCNGGPGASGCDVATSDAGGLLLNPFIVLANTANPASILPGQSTTFTASFVNSVGAALTPGQVSVLVGLPVVWNNVVLGTLANPQTVIQPNGQATATFIAGINSGTGQASANVDFGVATGSVLIPCPSITGNVTGGGTICAGSTAQVVVSLGGGVPPYSITLNNGGGTQSGYSPFYFNVSPASTTTYQISSGQDVDGCVVTASGGATVTVNPVPVATITTVPSVLADSSGNQASALPGYASYAWTILNGVIIGPTNQSAISYVAGVSGNVTLGLTVGNASGCSATATLGVPVLTGAFAHSSLTLTDAIPASTTTGIAYDGTNYWDCAGGSTSGLRLGCYTASGALIGTYSPGLDFRSVFTRPDGTVLARAYNTNVIYVQTSPGVFVNSGISLAGGTLNAQSSVVLSGAGTEFDAMYVGVVSRWSTNGAYLGSVNLQGYGSVSGENALPNSSPQNRGLAALGNLWLTYNGGGILSAWDFSGNRVLQIPLPGAGTSLDSDYSFSCCHGKVFIVDVTGGLWRSYDLFSRAAVAVLAAEPNASWNADVTNKIAATGAFPNVDFFPVVAGDPLPTPAQLQAYQSVLVYSDRPFNDNVALGNELADYVDQGGGVVLNTFAFYDGSQLGMAGRLTNNYLAFTLGSQSNVLNGTLVPDLPTDSLLAGVNSFNSGGNLYVNFPISIASGATQVAHWNNGQPLVGKKIDGPGRSVGLNFFPPSSDSFPGSGWDSTTDGAKLMANALAWAGQIAPTISTAPAGQVVPLGQTATFSVVAVGAPPLAYQWQLNGTNLPAATNPVLSVIAQAGNLGQYSVVVTNPYGQTCSVPVSLNPPLRFLPPSWSGNTLSLSLANADGSLIAPNRSTRVQLYATTNLSFPFNRWWPLTNAVLPASGLLQVNGLTTANTSGLFFRAAEIP